MSYDEYVQNLDYEDLQNLIKVCQNKMTKISESGKIPLFLVSCDCLNHFASPSEHEAREWMKALIKLLLDKDEFDEIRELRVHKKMIWRDELKDWEGFNTPPEQCTLYTF